VVGKLHQAEAKLVAGSFGVVKGRKGGLHGEPWLAVPMGGNGGVLCAGKRGSVLGA